jgi:hypothetical protein
MKYLVIGSIVLVVIMIIFINLTGGIKLYATCSVCGCKTDTVRQVTIPGGLFPDSDYLCIPCYKKYMKHKYLGE